MKEQRKYRCLYPVPRMQSYNSKSIYLFYLKLTSFVNSKVPDALDFKVKVVDVAMTIIRLIIVSRFHIFFDMFYQEHYHSSTLFCGVHNKNLILKSDIAEKSGLDNLITG